MGKRTKPAPRLGFWWVVRRELEIQARPSERHEYSYRGLWRPLAFAALLLVPWLCELYWSCGHCSRLRLRFEPGLSDTMQTSYQTFLSLYALYRAHAAACLGAGSLRDLASLRHAGVSPETVLAGKLVASLLPLWVEFAWMAPMLALALWSVGCSLQGLGLTFALLALQTVGFGLLGMGFAADAPARRGSVVGVRGFLFSLFYLPPLVFFLVFSRPGLLISWAPFGSSWGSSFGMEATIPQVAGLLMVLPNPAVQVLLTLSLVWGPGDLSTPDRVVSCLGIGTLLMLGVRRFRAISTRLR